MKVVAVTGASSFIGRYLLEVLANREDIEIKALIHEGHDNLKISKKNITTTEGNLLKPETLDRFAVPGCTLVNLAHLSGSSKEENLKAMFNLVEASAKAQIKRFIHCSTAVVSGRVRDEIIDENTKCNPIGEYEKIKLSVEKLLWEKNSDLYETVILRPTAVFGPNGKNLINLANDLNQKSKFINYIKSCLYNHRKMNLLYIDNLLSAIVFLIDTLQKMEREIFIVSDDEYDSNNYRDIEKCLMKRFGCKDYLFPRIPVPLCILSFILKMTGKFYLNLNSIYTCRKFIDAGFKKPVSLDEGLDNFAEWYRRMFLNQGKMKNSNTYESIEC